MSIEERIPASHPLRRIRKLADQALDRLNPTFCELYASEGRPSAPPEQLLLASLLQAFYGIRSEQLLLEQLHYNLAVAAGVIACVVAVAVAKAGAEAVGAVLGWYATAKGQGVLQCF